MILSCPCNVHESIKDVRPACMSTRSLKGLLGQLLTMHATTDNLSAELILITHGLRRCAKQLCVELSLHTMQDLANLSDEVIDSLPFLHEHQPEKLKALCQACREGDPDHIKEVQRRRRNLHTKLLQSV
jgi:hypothetical protein